MYEKKNSWCYFDDNHKEQIKNYHITITKNGGVAIAFTTKSGEYKVYENIRAIYLKSTEKDWDNEKGQHINSN